MGRKAVSKEIKDQIIGMWKTGKKSKAEIARNFHISVHCVRNTIKPITSLVILKLILVSVVSQRTIKGKIRGF